LRWWPQIHVHENGNQRVVGARPMCTLSLLIKRYKELLLSRLIATICTGCWGYPVYTGVFINSTSEQLDVELRRRDTPPTRNVLRSFAVRPQEVVRERLIITAEIVVKDEDGAQIAYLPHAAMTDPQYTYHGAAHPLRYYLMTSDGIYPIPLEFLPEWQEHTEQIVVQELRVPGPTAPE
jgi:hypothetical protein